MTFSLPGRDAGGAGSSGAYVLALKAVYANNRVAMAAAPNVLRRRAGWSFVPGAVSRSVRYVPQERAGWLVSTRVAREHLEAFLATPGHSALLRAFATRQRGVTQGWWARDPYIDRCWRTAEDLLRHV
jgi:hypothetical protein